MIGVTSVGCETFLSRDLDKYIFMKQPEGFILNKNDHMICKLKKSTHMLKQASHQWYLKFHSIISSFGFAENIMNQYIYHNFLCPICG